MRKRFRVLLLAAIVAAVVVPVGFALSLESTPVAARTPVVVAAAASTTAVPPLVVHGEPFGLAEILRPLPDGAKLFFVGTALFGLAAALRRAA